MRRKALRPTPAPPAPGGAHSVDAVAAPPPHGFAAAVLQVLFPMRCAFCGSRASGLAVCPACATALQPLALPPGEPQERLACAWLPRAAAVWQYDGLAKRALLQLKYYGARWRAPELARQMAAAARAAQLPPPDIIIPVPDTRRAARKKAYSTPQLLAEWLARQQTAPLAAGVLCKQYDTPAQHTLSRSRRAANPVGAYRVCDPQRLHGKSVWLVDDVVTTGATLRECARLLWLYGAAQVTGLCFCATQPKNHPAARPPKPEAAPPTGPGRTSATERNDRHGTE